MKAAIEARIEALEKTHGPGESGKIIKGLIYETSITEAGRLMACGAAWERRPGESDNALRKRALDESLKDDRRGLIRKIGKHYARLMRIATNAEVQNG